MLLEPFFGTHKEWPKPNNYSLAYNCGKRAVKVIRTLTSANRSLHTPCITIGRSSHQRIFDPARQAFHLKQKCISSRQPIQQSCFLTISEQCQQRHITAPASGAEEYARCNSLSPSKGKNGFDSLVEFFLFLRNGVEGLHCSKCRERFLGNLRTKIRLNWSENGKWPLLLSCHPSLLVFCWRVSLGTDHRIPGTEGHRKCLILISPMARLRTAPRDTGGTTASINIVRVGER